MRNLYDETDGCHQAGASSGYPDTFGAPHNKNLKSGEHDIKSPSSEPVSFYLRGTVCVRWLKHKHSWLFEQNNCPKHTSNWSNLVVVKLLESPDVKLNKNL
ncbi:hypothetical protein CHARACLAT_029134 [Characodon lateralis]|uniref:Uncharacterized protein n=1 Tax=Characodon lateralis TaxID=208331 RepID=A0ABU7EPH7_9TELE|nr:hypothetical protein [Characodon lateralis]